MPTISLRAGLGLAVVLTVAACSGGSASTQTPTAAPVTSAAPATTTGAAPSAAASTAALGTVNANTATQQELAAAFAAAGISNADRWAREVTEYRPYPADPSWALLRQELGKYNIDPAVLEQIIAILEV